MKTTIEIPDELAVEAKRVARERGTSLRDLVITGLRSEVDRRGNPARADFVFTTFDAGEGTGLADGIDPSDAIAMSYDA